MNQAQVCRLVEEALELDAESVKGHETLDELGWTSLAAVTFLALADEQGVQISPKELSKAKSVADLVTVIASKLVS